MKSLFNYLLPLCAMITLNAYADGSGVNPDVFNQILTNTNYIASTLKPALTYQMLQNYKAGPDDGNLIAGNSAKISNLSALDQALNATVAGAVNNLLNNSLAAGADSLKSNEPSVIAQGMAEMPGPDYPAPQLTAGNSNSIAGANNNAVSPTALNQPFTLDALLNPTYYNLGTNDKGAINLSNPPTNSVNANLPAPNDTAMNFIYYLSDLGNPPSSINYQILVDGNKIYTDSTDPNYNTQCGGQKPNYIIKNCIQNNSNVESYRLAYRSWVAAESVALSNLMQTYYQRMPIANLGKQAGMTASNDPIYPDASVLQVDEYMAKRRLTPAWAQQVASEPPATVQREMLLLLSEMRYEEYQQRLATERLNATLNTLLLTNARNTRQSLDNAKSTMQCAVNPSLCASQKAAPQQ